MMDSAHAKELSPLFLCDLAQKSEQQVREHIAAAYEVDPEVIDRYDILIAYESVGKWGCDSNSFFLLCERASDNLHEVHGSHCSCNGFEGQFEPEVTNFDYLTSERFHVFMGGYDDDDKSNHAAITHRIRELAQVAGGIQ